MKTLDWNDMSNLGIIYRINSEILHPMGLAMTRIPDTGSSDSILVASDGVFEYSEELKQRNESKGIAKSFDDVVQYMGNKNGC